MDSAAGLKLRGQLSRLNALLVLSMLMTDSQDEEQIIRLGASAAPSFADCRLVGVVMGNGRGTSTATSDHPLPTAGSLSLLPADGGAVDIEGAAWAWAFTLGGVGNSVGHMIVAAARAPDRDELFLLRALAQQTGTAIRNSRLHHFERTAADELATMNSKLEQTVQALQQRIDIHGRLTQAAVSGSGMDSIAQAVHDVTGMPVVIEDRFGNLRAFAGPGEAPKVDKDPPDVREDWLRRLVREGDAVWERGRVVRAASPRPDVVNVIALMDPDRQAAEADFAALEYGATILSMELARRLSAADTEIRLRRDLVEDLLAGTASESVVSRGEAFHHDLTRPHRVMLFERVGQAHDDDALFAAVRRATRNAGLGSLLAARGGRVVLLTDREADWEELHAAVVRELGRGRCRLGVGGRTRGVEDFPTSHREAQLSLNLVRGRYSTKDVVLFDQLGVFRLLASSSDPREVESYVEEWLGALIDYDAKHRSELVLTLYHYMDCGGHYDEAARALSIHRSTLKYRLQRIRDVSGMTLSEPEVKFNLQLACRAWRTLRALKA